MRSVDHEKTNMGTVCPAKLVAKTCRVNLSKAEGYYNLGKLASLRILTLHHKQRFLLSLISLQFALGLEKDVEKQKKKRN